MTNVPWLLKLFLPFVKNNQNSKYHSYLLSLNTAYRSENNKVLLHQCPSSFCIQQLKKGRLPFYFKSLLPPPLASTNMLVLPHTAQDIRVVSGIYWSGASFHKNQCGKTTGDPSSDPVCKYNSSESFGQKQRLNKHKSYKEDFKNRCQFLHHKTLYCSELQTRLLKKGKKKKDSQQLCKMMTDWEWVSRSSDVFYLMKHLTGVDSSHWVKMT